METKQLDGRETRAIMIAAMHRIDRQDGAWLVPSESAPGRKYKVNLNGTETCECLDCQEGGFVCKHIRAVKITIKRELGSDGSIVETRQMLFEEKKTYTQNWPCYDRAQMEEKHRFQVLLHDLCNGMEEPPLADTGRRPVPLCDRLFSVCYKIYSTFSARRFACDLNDAHERGYLTRALHCNKVSNFLESPTLTAPLQQLIARSSLPLRCIEKNFAVDSTGFSVARHVRWVDEKYGCERSGRDWVKVHICTGVTTNCVTAAAIYHRDAADSPVMPELIRETAKIFTIGDMSADKAYLSHDNAETVFGHGGTPFIAFKCNSTGSTGGLFEKMYHFYQYKREEYMSRYHARSNVESTFSAIKRKFGDHIRSRTDTAMMNEALGKMVCQNITCVIGSQIELGLEPVFWPKTHKPTTMRLA